MIFSRANNLAILSYLKIFKDSFVLFVILYVETCPSLYLFSTSIVFYSLWEIKMSLVGNSTPEIEFASYLVYHVLELLCIKLHISNFRARAIYNIWRISLFHSYEVLEFLLFFGLLFIAVKREFEFVFSFIFECPLDWLLCFISHSCQEVVNLCLNFFVSNEVSRLIKVILTSLCLW
jgi:hypothetical protein